MDLDILWVQPSWVVDSRISLDNANDLSSLSNDVLGEVVSYITETLDNNGLSLHAFAKISLIAEALGLEKSVHNMEDTKTSGLGSS